MNGKKIRIKKKKMNKNNKQWNKICEYKWVNHAVQAKNKEWIYKWTELVNEWMDWKKWEREWKK